MENSLNSKKSWLSIFFLDPVGCRSTSSITHEMLQQCGWNYSNYPGTNLCVFVHVKDVTYAAAFSMTPFGGRHHRNLNTAVTLCFLLCSLMLLSHHNIVLLFHRRIIAGRPTKIILCGALNIFLVACGNRNTTPDNKIYMTSDIVFLHHVLKVIKSNFLKQLSSKITTSMQQLWNVPM